MNGSGRTRRSAEQCSNRAIGGTDHLRTELKRPFASGNRIFDNLHALARNHDIPILALGVRNELP
ncbi:hypothetical protein D3C73_1561650 [compost metagenome]